MRILRRLLLVSMALCGLLAPSVYGQLVPAAGPLWDRFPLTFEAGSRTEVLGPLFSRQHKDSATEHRWTPLLSYTRDPEVELTELDFAYPLLTYDRFGTEYRFQIIQWFSFSGGASVTESERKRFSLFPFYFQQRSTNPDENYTALVPFHGRLQNRFFRDEVKFTLMPLYVQSRKRDVVTDNAPYPFFHLRRGDGLKGWQAWPLVGHEHKEVTTRVDDFGDDQVVPGHDKWMALWPFFFHNHTGIGSTNAVRERALLPLYSWTRSPARDSTTVLWPFFTWTDDREKGYREWDLPYPLIVFARGEGKTGNRVWPFYSRMTNATHESRFVAWPIYKYNKVDAAPLLRERTRWLFFFYSDLREANTTTGRALDRHDCWPLFTHRRDREGNERLQILAPIEPFLPNNKGIERNYSPAWSLWRSERSERTGAASQSLFWNLYRRDVSKESTKCSLLFGLFQYQSTPDSRRWRVFYVPFGDRASDAEQHP
jgi:hypothetical protein